MAIKRGLAAGIIAGSVALTTLATGLVSRWEGMQVEAYRDLVGVWTQCAGHTQNVVPGSVKTLEECNSILAQDLIEFERGLDACLTGYVPDKMKVALLSWSFNVGVGAACGSTLVRLANDGKLREACEQLPRWNKARVGGVLTEVKGLTNRRAEEKQLCLRGVEDAALGEPYAPSTEPLVPEPAPKGWWETFLDGVIDWLQSIFNRKE